VKIVTQDYYLNTAYMFTKYDACRFNYSRDMTGHVTKIITI